MDNFFNLTKDYYANFPENWEIAAYGGLLIWVLSIVVFCYLQGKGKLEKREGFGLIYLSFLASIVITLLGGPATILIVLFAGLLVLIGYSSYRIGKSQK